MKYIILFVLCSASFVANAQFRLHTKWTNSLQHTSGPDAGITRIARELIFATPEANTLKMVDPFTVIARPTKPISIDMENGVYVNNIGTFDAKLFDAALNRYIIALPMVRLSDTKKDGKTFGRGKRVYLALYKNNFDSTRLTVVEKHASLSWTIGNQSPVVRVSSPSISEYTSNAVKVDSLEFRAAAGTSTGSIAKPIDLTKAFPQSIKANKPIVLPGYKAPEEEEEDQLLNITRTSTSFRFMVKSIETLNIDTDDEKAVNDVSFKNKAEYLGVLVAEAITNAKVFSVNFFNLPSKSTGSHNSVRLAIGEKRAIPNSGNTIFTIPRNQFETAKLRFAGSLAEIDEVTKLEMPYTSEFMLENNQFREVLLKNLFSGTNYFDIKRPGVGFTLRVHFEIEELN